MSRAPSTIDVGAYTDEVQRRLQNPPPGYTPATAREPRRRLTWNGEPLAGTNNGEGRNNWRHRRNVSVHAALTGAGYAYGLAVAACNGALELGQDAELADLVKANTVDEMALCRRPACRALWPQTSVPAPAQTSPSKGDQVT